MRARTCDYVKPNGHLCGSLALRGRDYCHFHVTSVQRQLRAETQRAIAQGPPLELPPLEDINSIQIALMQVMNGLLQRRKKMDNRSHWRYNGHTQLPCS